MDSFSVSRSRSVSLSFSFPCFSAELLRTPVHIFTVHEYTRVYLVSSVAMTIITCVWLTISMCVYIYIYVLLIMSVTHFNFCECANTRANKKSTEETDHEYDGDKKWWEDIDWGPLANFGDKLWRVPADCCDVIKSKWVHDASIWPFYCQYDPQIVSSLYYFRQRLTKQTNTWNSAYECRFDAFVAYHHRDHFLSLPARRQLCNCTFVCPTTNTAPEKPHFSGMRVRRWFKWHVGRIK